MKQNNGMALPEDFVDMNDVETGYVDGKGPGGKAGGATCHLVKEVPLHIYGTFSDTYITEGLSNSLKRLVPKAKCALKKR